MISASFHLSKFTIIILCSFVLFYPIEIQGISTRTQTRTVTGIGIGTKSALMHLVKNVTKTSASAIATRSSFRHLFLPTSYTRRTSTRSTHFKNFQRPLTAFISYNPILMSKKRNFNTMATTATMMAPSSSSSSSLPPPQQQESSFGSGTHKKLLIILAGPTAVGKSSIGSKLCSQQMATDIMTNHALQNSLSETGNNNIKRETIDDSNSGNSTSNSGNIRTLNSKGHIISADSVQVYQGVQVGANKPTKEEIEKTPHHLINIVDGDSVCQYNAADWMRDALYVIDKLTHYDGIQPKSEEENNSSSDDEDYVEQDDMTKNNGNNNNSNDDNNLVNNEVVKQNIQTRKRIKKYISEQFSSIGEEKVDVLPVVVGGTMMYLQWLVHGRPDAMKPSEDAVKKAASTVAKFKKEEEQKMEQDENMNENNDNEGSSEVVKESNLEIISGWEAAVDHASSLGPIFADRVSKLSGRDWYRLRRTLEVAYTALDDTENKLKIEDLYNGQRQGGLDSMEYDVRCFFLCPDDRMTHTGVVDSRCEDMLLSGLLKETADLSLKGLLPPDGQQARAIGYRQTLDYLKRINDTDDDSSFDRYLDEFTTATRRYAKKQMQWFRRDGKFMFVPVKLSDPSTARVDTAAKIIRDMCILPRKDFEKELAPAGEGSEADKQLPISAKTKLDNENQGKTMKFYRGKRHKLIQGTDDYKRIILEANESTSRMKNKSPK